jgi:hypothetical protein
LIILITKYLKYKKKVFLKNFKAAVLVNLKKKLKILDLKYLNELKEGQVLVKLITSGICGAQLNEIKGIKGPDKYLPHMMGHEGYGQVVKVGSGVIRVKQKDNVIMHWRKSDGHNVSGSKYKSAIGEINSGQVTTFSEYAIVSENRVTKVKLNKKLLKLAPLFGCSLTTAFGVVYNEANIIKDNKILVIGCGGLGLSIAAMARTRGVENIFFVDKNFNKYKLNFLNNLNLKKLNLFSFNKKIFEKKKFSGHEFDKIIDTTGNVEIISKCFSLLANNGHLVLVGQPKYNQKLTLNNPLKFFSGIKIFASDGGLINPGKDLNNVINVVKNNYKYFCKLISHYIFLKDINYGINLLKTNKALRIIIKF